MEIPEIPKPNVTVNVEPTPVEMIVQPPPVNVAAPNVNVTVEPPKPRRIRVETLRTASSEVETNGVTHRRVGGLPT